MRARVTRHLDDAVAAADGAELVGRDRVVYLLRIAASIEHSLMVQYLFAGWSLGGPGSPAAARRWQETLLEVAKEEMAHLLTVQNLLVCLGAPMYLDRDDFPNDDDRFYPFGFRLRPATADVLATYVCAESPDGWDDAQAREIKARAQVAVGAPVNRVGVLYAELAAALASPQTVPDGDFATTTDGQAVFADWARGYRPGQAGSVPLDALPELVAPELLILPATSRDSAVDAVRRIGEQGESLTQPAGDDPSHFRRFLAVYEEMAAAGGDPARPVAANPVVDDAADGAPEDPDTATAITHPRARLWARLGNVRYRKLLLGLQHALALTGVPGTDGSRGMLVHRTFAEMYQLRAVAGHLVELPVADDGGPARAGMPFQMPFMLTLPPTEPGRWRLHRDLLDAADGLVTALKELGGPAGEQDHLLALADADAAERAWVVRAIGGQP